MAVLGDAASGGLYVCVDGLGKVSLCGGYIWRGYDGDVGVRDWEVDYAEARSGGASVSGSGCSRENSNLDCDVTEVDEVFEEERARTRGQYLGVLNAERGGQ